MSVTRTALLLAAAVAATPAQALKHVWPESLPGVGLDQTDVVRLPNVSAQLRYYVVALEAGPVVWVPQRHVDSNVHPAEREEAEARAARSGSWVPMQVLPSGPLRAALRLVLGGWIGGGMIHPVGRMDGFGSFMPPTVPLKARFRFAQAIPPDFGGKVVGPLEVELEAPAAKVLDRSYVFLPFTLPARAPAQDASVTLVLNGHEFRPIALRFTGRPLVLPEAGR